MILNKIKEMIQEILEDQNIKIETEINSDTELRDLGLTSIDLATLTVMIEDEYGVDVFEEEIIRTVGELIKKIENK